MKFFIRIIVVLSALVLNEMAVAQYMNDGSSLYSDTWGDSFGVWGYGQLVGRLNIQSMRSMSKLPAPKDALPLPLECTAHMAEQRRAKRTFLGI
jgi:hypothetical protein